MNKNILYIALVLPILFTLTACGGILPNRLTYDHDMTPEDMKRSPHEGTVVTTSENSKTQMEAESAGEDTDGLQDTNFDESYARKMASKAPDKGEQDPYRYRKEREVRKEDRGLVDAQASDLGYNALSRTFAAGYEKTFNTVVDAMLFLPLRTVSKGGGLITTEWTMDKNLNYETLAGINVFGDGTRLVRYRYNVRFYNRGSGRTEVVVIPFAQITKNRRWFDGKPAVAITEKLMRKIIKEMEG